MAEIAEPACAHCGAPHPERDDPDNAMCSVMCAVDSGGYVEGLGIDEVAACYVEELKQKYAEDDELHYRLPEGIARLLRWLVAGGPAASKGKDDALVAALNAYLAGAPQ
jgi:hypothetical protein